MSLQIQGSHGNLLRMLGETEPALLSLREALALTRSSLPEDHPQQGVIRRALGQAELAQGNRQAAVPLLEESLSILSDLLGPEHQETVQTRLALAEAQAAPGAVESARQ